MHKMLRIIKISGKASGSEWTIALIRDGSVIILRENNNPEQILNKPEKRPLSAQATERMHNVVI